jgi:ATP-dependent DNA helicase HFM1/MER3
MVERKLVFERLNRLVRAVIDCKGHDRDSVGTKTALELARSLVAGSWEGRATQLTQVPNIGPVGMRKLASKNIRTVLELAAKDYDEIERLMSRQAPFGKKLQADLERFPRLDMDLAVVSWKILPRSEEPVVIEVKATLRYLNRNGPPNWSNRVPALTFLVESGNGTLAYFWRGSMRKLDKQSGFELGFSVGLRNVRDCVVCHFSCEEIVGTVVSKTLEHKVPASTFPSQRPPANPGSSQRSKSANPEYLDDDGIDDADLILAAEQAVSHPSIKQGTKSTTEVDNEYPSVEELLNTGDTEREAPSPTFDDELANGHGDENEMDAAPAREPIRLPNGKWQCNHSCSGGAPTRSGKPCSHKCCKDGLDKPRKRPLQRPKRKREEPTIEEAVGARRPGASQTRLQQSSKGTVSLATTTQEKRHKVHAMPSSTEAQFASPSGRSTKTPPNTGWKDADFDAMDLECIDLSWMDDEDDDLKLHSGEASCWSSKAERNEANKAASKGPPSKQRGNDNIHEVKTVSSHAPSSVHGASYTAASATATSNTQRGDYFDDDDFSLFDETLSARSLPTPTSAAFRSGASDTVLYQGISKKFAECRDASSPREDTADITGAAKSILGGPVKPDNPSPSLFVDDDCSGKPPEKPLDSSTTVEPVPTNIGKEKRLKAHNEPAWVAEFDPEFVDMFRGYVTFV